MVSSHFYVRHFNASTPALLHIMGTAFSLFRSIRTRCEALPSRSPSRSSLASPINAGHVSDDRASPRTGNGRQLETLGVGDPRRGPGGRGGGLRERWVVTRGEGPRITAAPCPSSPPPSPALHHLQLAGSPLCRFFLRRLLVCARACTRMIICRGTKRRERAKRARQRRRESRKWSP